MFVTHFAITVAHQILAVATNIRCYDFSALADLSPKLTMSCTPMYIHSVGHIYETGITTFSFQNHEKVYSCNLNVHSLVIGLVH